MLYKIDSLVFVALLFIGIILLYFIGLNVSYYKKKRNPDHKSTGIGPFEGAMLGLISLLLAFTFNQSASYYNSRWELLMHETNCIGTVILRSDLYPDSVRDVFRNDLREYVVTRVEYYEAGGNEDAILAALQKANIISKRIWNLTSYVSQKDPDVVKSMQMIPAVCDMIDAVGSREEARKAHVPESILWLLLILCFAGSFIVGYASKSKKADWIVLLSYSLITVLTIFVILDLDQPRHGIIDTSSTHQNMHDLLNTLQDEGK